MKNRIIEAAILALGIVILGLCIKGGFDNFTNKDRRVTVKGLAEKQVMADVVTWNFTVTMQGDDIGVLSKAADRDLTSIRKWLFEKGCNAQDSIEIEAPTVTNNYDNVYDGKKPLFKYTLTKMMSVNSHRTKMISDIINKKGELFDRGIYSYTDFATFDYTQFQKLKPQMMQDAIANAEKTAQQFAKNSHSDLNKILEADQGEFSIDDGDKPYMKKVRVVSTITYSLKD
ncbi:MAG: SIMPL domain-containing protein [Prevotella sp.]|jgi:hypothetical protein|nr:SIMPL domain-containing protein [Prevotella sp.]MCI1282836.1 SIMPL domain-containing protein [Prevotella sp.]